MEEEAFGLAFDPSDTRMACDFRRRHGGSKVFLL